MWCLLCLVTSTAFAQHNLKDNSLLAMGTPLYDTLEAMYAAPGDRDCNLNAEAQAAVGRMVKALPKSKVWKGTPTKVNKKRMSVIEYHSLGAGEYYFCAIHGKNIKGRAWYDYPGGKGYDGKREDKAISICNGFYLESKKSVELWFDSVDKDKACVQIVLIKNS